MKKIVIDETDIILDDIGENQGKIIVSNHFVNASYYWGAMGMNLENFILKINEDYFVRNLCSNRLVFSAKKSIQNVREEFKKEFPFYKHMEFQKELRAELKRIEKTCESEYQFVDEMQNLKYKVDFDLIKDKFDKEEIINFLTFEPWHRIAKVLSPDAIFLQELLPKLKKEISKSLSLHSA